MNRLALGLLLLALPACAHLVPGSGARDRLALWDRAHAALDARRFEEARLGFQELVSRFGKSREGREALFYVGSIHLDPRNPAWNPGPAEEALARYLAQDTLEERLVARRPEARILLEIAHQLNLPPQSRIAALQPPAATPTPPPPAPVVTRAQPVAELLRDIERLRVELAQRDETIRRQREELERIRRTLTPAPP